MGPTAGPVACGTAAVRAAIAREGRQDLAQRQAPRSSVDGLDLTIALLYERSGYGAELRWRVQISILPVWISIAFGSISI